MPYDSETIAEKEVLVAAYEAGRSVLEDEAGRIQEAVGMLAPLADDEADQILLPLAAEAATEDGLATSAVDVMPTIQKAVQALDPEQSDPNAPANQRWTMDWGAVRKKIEAKAVEHPELPDQLNTWYLTNAYEMIETTISNARKNTLYDITGAANDQPLIRSLLAMVDMATPEFREAHGLITRIDHSLKGEDGRAPGWFRDAELVAALRAHIAQRIQADEIAPKIVVMASGSRPIPDQKPKDGVLQENLEYTKIKNVLYPEVPNLFGERTEADAMLAGAMRNFGGDPSTISVVDVPAEGNPLGHKLVSFESELGRVEMIATTDSDANILRQVQLLGEHKPELFEGIEAFVGTTTAIYTWAQRPILREAASKIGLKDVEVDMLGSSAHMAGMDRKLETLIGEHAKYLGAMYNLARRMMESAELNTQLDVIAGVGTIAVASTQN